MKFHHVGIVVEDLPAAIGLYRQSLSAELERQGEGDGMSYALLHLGGSELELMHSADPESPVGRFLARRGPGLHHVAFEVGDLAGELARLRAGGYEIVGDVRAGIHGTQVAFVHPNSMGGVLTELVERER